MSRLYDYRHDESHHLLETSPWRYEFNLTGTYLKSSDVFWPYHIMRENNHKKTIDFGR